MHLTNYAKDTAKDTTVRMSGYYIQQEKLRGARTELIITAGKHQRLPRRDMHARESLMLSCVGDQLCPDPGVFLASVVCRY